MKSEKSRAKDLLGHSVFLCLAATCVLVVGMDFAKGAAENPKTVFLLVNLERYGFEPNQVTIPHNRVILVVHNKSGLSGINLTLDRVAGSRLQQVQVPTTQRRWNAVFDLAPGQYLLSESGHPGWRFSITVLP